MKLELHILQNKKGFQYENEIEKHEV